MRFKLHEALDTLEDRFNGDKKVKKKCVRFSSSSFCYIQLRIECIKMKKKAYHLYIEIE